MQTAPAAVTEPAAPRARAGEPLVSIIVLCRNEVAYTRLCLDTSHSRLATNFLKLSFKDFVDIVAPHIAHLHIVDAKGVDGEGVQIGEGEIDFAALAEQLSRIAPRASFIPEIWQGHKNYGEGFWVACERLEKWFSAPAAANVASTSPTGAA